MNFHKQLKTFLCTLTIYTGDKVQKQTIEAPRIMLEHKFLSLVEQASNTTTPIKVVMSRKIPIYDNFDEKWIEREAVVEFANNAWKE